MTNNMSDIEKINNIIWNFLEVHDVHIDPLLSDGRELLNFLYNAVNTNKFDDAKLLINSTENINNIKHVIGRYRYELNNKFTSKPK